VLAHSSTPDPGTGQLRRERQRARPASGRYRVATVFEGYDGPKPPSERMGYLADRWAKTRSLVTEGARPICSIWPIR